MHGDLRINFSSENYSKVSYYIHEEFQFVILIFISQLVHRAHVNSVLHKDLLSYRNSKLPRYQSVKQLSAIEELC